MKHWLYDDSSRLIAEMLAHNAMRKAKGSPQIFNLENFGPDIGDKKVTDEKTMRHNAGKSELSHVLEFEAALDELAEVCRKGAIKYARGNWKKGGPNVSLQSLCDSALRHMRSALSGEKRDPELGTLHVAQAAWNMLAATYWELKGEEEEDIVEVRRDEIEWNDKAKD